MTEIRISGQIAAAGGCCQRAARRLIQVIALGASGHENTTRDLLEDIRESEEEQVVWFEVHRTLIEEVGALNDLAQQIRD